ncbi:hypothetical protein, conserved [Leishmania tarentolae]|uniref:Nudix hydrolase domain-containing protein n=1 Tax=Leishmania tarentolae TaxID=5689 RepID=A0A640K8X0_LEITA|nr:hypothetical protein, conserved [Leishmania tarentolae]
MPSGIPGVDLVLLTHVARRLAERRLHAYHPGGHRSAAALVLRFDDDTQRTLTKALSSFRAATERHGGADLDATETHTSGAASPRISSSSTSAASSMTRGSTKGSFTDPLKFFEYLAHHRHHHQCSDVVDADAPSSLQLLFVKRLNMEARRWSGHVVFPGGRRDPDDHDDFDTVCRETYEEIGFPLQHHREFLCLGRLPDYRLHSRIVDSRGFVQARFVFLHVGDITPTVQLASHEVESVRWVPLRGLREAHVERGRVAHPLQSFVNPQAVDTRLLVREMFPNTYVSFPSLLLPGTPAPSSSPAAAGETEGGRKGCREDGERARTPEDARSASAESPLWRIWGLTLRTANELLSLDCGQTLDWPLVESNSSLLQYGIILPVHGYYELLYQLYRGRAWITATMRLRDCDDCVADRETNTSDEQQTSRTFDCSRSGSLLSTPLSHRSRERQRWRRVLYGSAVERRYAVLPVSADALLLAVPETPTPEHVASFAVALGFVAFVLYTMAAVISSVCAAVGAALGLKADLDSEARRRAYYDANTPSSMVRHRRPAAGHGAELRSPERLMEDSDAAVSAADAAALSCESINALSGWPRQARDNAAPCSRAIVDEAGLSAELHRTTEILHGEPLLSSDSVAPQDARRQLPSSTDTPAMMQPLTSKASATMHPKLPEADAGLAILAVSPSRATVTTNRLSISPAISVLSAGGSTEEVSEAEKERHHSRPMSIDVAAPAENLVAAAMPADALELRHEEELKAVMRRYRPQSTASQ